MKLRKKLAKVIAIMAIGAMSISTFASESQTTLPVLTLEQAVSSALSADATQMEAYEKSIGTYGRFDDAVKYIDPRKE